jgi:hypothetical protein
MYTRSLAQRRSQMIQAYRGSQIKLIHRVFQLSLKHSLKKFNIQNKSSNWNNDNSVNRPYKASFKSCPPMRCQPAQTSRRRWDPLNGPTRMKRMTSPRCIDLLKVRRNLKFWVRTTTLSILILSRLTWIWTILSRLLNMQGFWMLGLFCQKTTKIDPYFQYFSYD